MWKEHFNILLGNSPRVTDKLIPKLLITNMKLGQFSQEELDVVLTKIKIKKATGLDEIPPEVWKTWKFNNLLLRYCNAVYNQNTIERCTKGSIVQFPKNGDLGIGQNYRVISFSFIAAKVYNVRWLGCIEIEIEKNQRKNRNVFWGKRFTISQILTMRGIFL